MVYLRPVTGVVQWKAGFQRPLRRLEISTKRNGGKVLRNTTVFTLGASILLAGCSYVGGLVSGPEEVLPANTIADASRPLAVRANYLAGSTEYAFLSTEQLLAITQSPRSVARAVAERSSEGVIIRGVALARSQGYTKPVLVRDPEAWDKDPANPVYLVRLTPPAEPLPVGNTVSREVLFAGFLTAVETQGMRSITLVAENGNVRLRLR